MPRSNPPRPRRSVASPRLLVLVAAVATMLPVTGAAQEQPTPPVVPVPPVPGGVSPTGAFLRAVLVPGWGHASIGSYRRAGFYFVAESVTAWGVLKTRKRLAEATARADLREMVLRAELATQGVTEETEIEDALGEDGYLTDLRALEESRSDQIEDWAALGIFLLFLSGADAYVSAHLRDFPTPLELNTQVVGDRVELSVGIKLPN